MSEEPLHLYSRAKRIIERQLGFWIHVAFFAGVNIVLASINLIRTPHKLWFIFPLLSWGLAIYFHFLFAMVFHEENIQKWKRILHSKRKTEALVLFWLHAAFYCGVCLFLVALDRLLGDDKTWAVWPVIGWGVGLLTHGLCVWIFTDKYFKQIAAKIQSHDLIEARVYLKVHLITYAFTNSAIILLNLFLHPSYLFSLWILFGWGIGLACHWLWIVANRGHRIKKWKQQKALEMMEQLKE